MSRWGRGDGVDIRGVGESAGSRVREGGGDVQGSIDGDWCSEDTADE